MAGEIALVNKILSGIFGLMLIFVGSIKVSDQVDPAMHEMLVQASEKHWSTIWNVPPQYSGEFLIAIGLVEIIGGLAVMSKIFSNSIGTAGSGLMTVQMTCAVLTHVMMKDTLENTTGALVFLALAVITFTLGFIGDSSKKKGIPPKKLEKIKKSQ